MSSANSSNDRSVQSSTVCSSTTPSILESSNNNNNNNYPAQHNGSGNNSNGHPLWDIASQGSSELPYELAASSAAWGVHGSLLAAEHQRLWDQHQAAAAASHHHHHYQESFLSGLGSSSHSDFWTASSTSMGASSSPSTTTPSPTSKMGRSKSAKKRRRIASIAQRRAANIRERRRMYNLNEAFDRLRTKVPTFAYEKRLSRIETLRLAITYISFMDEILSGDGRVNNNNNINKGPSRNGLSNISNTVSQLGLRSSSSAQYMYPTLHHNVCH
ncbi:uncharacterized protein [Lepeophtheirus salmonis]|uniref:Fer3like (Drosophila) [Anas platyrhynchos] n=1 Tax=Lepeophtheirus salmonis TaxID=72036 RepID=A0A0K2TVT9_LEPSM|nr:protein dimmed-like [Lepeophtheirus salmonis]